MKKTISSLAVVAALVSPSVFAHSDYSKDVESIKKMTGCSVLVNTSFNVRGEPMVLSPEDAFRCFMGTNLDILVIEDFILFKSEQEESLKKDYTNEFNLD